MTHLGFLLSLLAALVLLSGCDEAVTPPGSIEAYFTLWGAFDPSADRQAIRVVPIESEIGTGTADPLGVDVTSTDLASGLVTTWRDSVITYGDGTIGHVFLADFRPEFGRRYRFDVLDGDGRSTSAATRVPPLVVPFREATEFITGDVRMPVLWPGAPQLNNIEIVYELENGNCDRFTQVTPFVGNAEPFEFGWRTTILLAEAADVVLGLLDNRPHAVARMWLQAEVASEDWRPPGGVFDPEVFIEPGTFSNVERGFGFVGGSYATSTSFWVPEAEALTRVGFQTPGFGACLGAGSPSEPN